MSGGGQFLHEMQSPQEKEAIRRGMMNERINAALTFIPGNLKGNIDPSSICGSGSLSNGNRDDLGIQ